MKHALALLLMGAMLAACGGLDLVEEDTLDAPSAAPGAAPSPSPRGEAPKIPQGPRHVQPADIGEVGPVCGDPRIIGARIPKISHPRAGCGIEAPVSLVEVAGVTLAGKTQINCKTAKALADWMEDAARPTARRVFSKDLAAVRVAASYSCRGRNRRAGARLSEHAKGNAVDISDFVLADGRSFDLETGWRDKSGPRAYLRSVWEGACGPFGTVLGPESDRYHRDHFHFDTARYRNGNYCK